MTALERYRAVLAGEPVDYPARVPILMRFAAEHIGSNYGAFAADYRVLVAANLRCAADFDFDQVSCISDPYREAAGFGAAIEFVRDGVPRASRPLAETKDLGRLLRPDPRTSPRMLDRVRAVEEYRARCAGRYSILGWVEGPAAAAANLRGVERFLVDLMRDPEFAAELMDLCTEVAIDFARAQIAAGADTVGVGDAIASQVSPAVYERLILPRARRLMAGIREASGLVKLHICGDITHLLPHLATLPLDVLDVDWMVDLRAVRRAVGPRVALAGNVDPVRVVRFGTPESTRAALLAAHCAAGMPWLAGAGCEVPSGTPVENLRALCAPRVC